MKLNYYQVDAFTDAIFGGNPACVVPLDEWLPDELLLKIAKENAVPETAFFIPSGDAFELRWFTPEIEMDLCGHATLATAHVLKQHLSPESDNIIFQSKSGELQVTIANELYTMDFPSRMPARVALPAIIQASLSIQPTETWLSRDYMLVYESEQAIREIQINRQVLDQVNLDPGGIIITAKGEQCDFVSRFFTPQASIFEDPVTGSSHCSLIPYWSKRLGKTKMIARQLSERGGKLFCEDKGDRVLIAGHARTYSMGTLWTE
ncbi:PhzF family phenazine biosynthesis protein [Terrimonas alba]|uniref:PhzF family phenazine biosynthesis protein n=1 Tax=Terrimonas alba TaxID=3349636 RepID=UPI0035F41893